MDAYVAMGCRPTWTCAPYQLPERPALGEHVAWAESNAIVFANSVLGARTDRYGDFIDICCAITGRAPAAGLHLDEEPARPRRVPGARACPSVCSRDEAAYARDRPRRRARDAARRCPAIVGLPADTTEDQLKALGAAAASSGAVAMFHAVGVTPEAPTLEAAHRRARRPTLEVDDRRSRDLRAARDELSTVEVGAAVGSVSLGTPHCSAAELGASRELVAAGAGSRCPCYVNTGRDVLAAGADGADAASARASRSSPTPAPTSRRSSSAPRPR